MDKGAIKTGKSTISPQADFPRVDKPEVDNQPLRITNNKNNLYKEELTYSSSSSFPSSEENRQEEIEDEDEKEKTNIMRQFMQIVKRLDENQGEHHQITYSQLKRIRGLMKKMSIDDLKEVKDNFEGAIELNYISKPYNYLIKAMAEQQETARLWN